MSTDYAKQLRETGQVWLRSALEQEDLIKLESAFSTGGRPGQRIVPSSKLVGMVSDLDILKPVYPKQDFKPVRIVSFDKSSGSNWGVPWHQDRVIAVAEKTETSGFAAWTRKSGFWHCEAPEAVLARMLFVRIHLDDTDQNNGAMQIASGSHRLGMIASDMAAYHAASCVQETCAAKRGDVHILHMLTLHRSLPSSSPNPRRVLRVDYATDPLPYPLRWATQA